MKQNNLLSSLSRKRTIKQLTATRLIYSLFSGLCLLLLSGCGSANVFGKASVYGGSTVETIPFIYNKIPIVEVEINSKKYQFLVDTGAPTIISNEVYDELHLQTKAEKSLEDSQGVSNKQKFVIVPTIKLGNLTYQNVGAVVNDLKDSFEIGCIGIDGVLGANQMALSIWKFDYQKQEIEIAQSISSFNLDGYKTIEFSPYRPQMTPLVKLEIAGNTEIFTYDSGFTGSLHIYNENGLDGLPFIQTSGTSSAGIYGTGTVETRKSYKVPKVSIGEISLNDIVVKKEQSSVLGNKLIENYHSIIDWNTNKIYWKEITAPDLGGIKTFGFSYRTNELQGIVANTINEVELPFKIGDTLISIDDLSLQNLDKATACEITNNKFESDLDQVKVRFFKNGKEKDVVLIKRTLLKD